MLNARSIAHTVHGASGMYVPVLLEQLGIAEQMRPKTVTRQGGYIGRVVAAGEADEFGGAQSGLGGEQQHGVVAAAGPGAAVGRGEQRVDLRFGQERDQRALEALGRDRQNPPDRGGVLGVSERCVAKQRADRASRALRVRTLLWRSCSR